MMSEIRNIIHRLKMGQSKRKIERDTRVHRTIIRKAYDLALMHNWLDLSIPIPSDEEIAKIWNPSTKISTAHTLDAHKEQITEWVEKQYTSTVIHNLLKDKCDTDVQAIRRYRKKHFPRRIEPVMVRSTVPGRDLELDFGELGKFLNDDGVLQKVWLFSFRLRHSRKAYREITLDQKLSTFLMGHVHAFEHFNGIPQNCIPDNLKAAVVRSTVDNDMINRSYQDLAEYYGFVIAPCLPRRPNHKGGVEGDVKYVKGNFLSYFLAKQKELGITVPKICDLIVELDKWDREVADIHIIQGIGRSPLEIFTSEEKQSLRPLPKQRWDQVTWKRSTVRRDWRVMIDSSYYSVPYLLIGKTVDVCISASFVRIFYEHKEVALHTKATKKLEYKRKTEHAPPFEEAVLQCSRESLLAAAGEIGPFTLRVATTILGHPNIDKLRPVRQLLLLSKKHPKKNLEEACARADSYKTYSYNSIKMILKKDLESQPIEGKNAHKVIPLEQHRFARDPADYKSGFTERETFEEKLERLHPYSRHGNAMLGPYLSLLADQMIDETEHL